MKQKRRGRLRWGRRAGRAPTNPPPWSTEPHRGAGRAWGSGGEGPARTLRACCGTLPSGRGPPLTRGGLRRGRGALARQRARVAGDLRLRAATRGQPPLGGGPGRRRVAERVAEPGRVADLGREPRAPLDGRSTSPAYSEGSSAGCPTGASASTGLEALPPPRARQPLRRVGGWRPDARLPGGRAA